MAKRHRRATQTTVCFVHQLCTDSGAADVHGYERAPALHKNAILLARLALPGRRMGENPRRLGEEEGPRVLRTLGKVTKTPPKTVPPRSLPPSRRSMAFLCSRGLYTNTRSPFAMGKFREYVAGFRSRSAFVPDRYLGHPFPRGHARVKRSPFSADRRSPLCRVSA